MEVVVVVVMCVCVRVLCACMRARRHLRGRRACIGCAKSSSALMIGILELFASPITESLQLCTAPRVMGETHGWGAQPVCTAPGRGRVRPRARARALREDVGLRGAPPPEGGRRSSAGVAGLEFTRAETASQ